MTIKQAGIRDPQWVQTSKLQAQINDLLDRVGDLEARTYAFAEGEATLTASSSTTTVTVTDLLSTDRVLISPADAGAASLDGAAYVSAVSAGSFTLTHDNSTLTRTYNWAALRTPT